MAKNRARIQTLVGYIEWKSLFSALGCDSWYGPGIRKSEELVPLCHPTEFQLFRGKAREIPRKTLLLLGSASSPGEQEGSSGAIHAPLTAAAPLGEAIPSAKAHPGGFIDSKRETRRVPPGGEPKPEQIFPFTSQLSPQSSCKRWGEELPPFPSREWNSPSHGQPALQTGSSQGNPGIGMVGAARTP